MASAEYALTTLLDDQPIELGSRAFDLLIALIEASRKVLGKNRDIIKTIPGRGYLFTADVDFVNDRLEERHGRCRGR